MAYLVSLFSIDLQSGIVSRKYNQMCDFFFFFEKSVTPKIHGYLLHVWVSLPLRTIHYYAELGQRSVFPTCEVPEHFVGQVTVLKYFSHYMEENLMDVSYSCLLLLSFFMLRPVSFQCLNSFAFPGRGPR